MAMREDSEVRQARKMHTCKNCGFAICRGDDYLDLKFGHRRHRRFCLNPPHWCGEKFRGRLLCLPRAKAAS